LVAALILCALGLWWLVALVSEVAAPPMPLGHQDRQMMVAVLLEDDPPCGLGGGVIAGTAA